MSESLTPPTPKTPLWKKYWKVDQKKPYPHLKGPGNEQSDGSDQLIVYRKNNDDNKFDDWIRAIQKEIKDAGGDAEKIEIVSVCGTCDESLLLLTGKGIKMKLTTEAASKGNTRAAGVLSGESNGVYYSANVKIKLPPLDKKKLPDKYISLQPPGFDPNLPVINVAVFDSGLTPREIDGFLIDANIQNPCIPNARQGWNFTVPDNNLVDEHALHHGSNVSRFIINQSLKEKGNPVRIITIKIHSREGMTDLYSILCGLAYAKHRGAHIINASFGYYAPINTDKFPPGMYGVDLFRKFVEEQLTKNNILLIAAAGNKASDAEIKQHFRGLYKVPLNPRDLGEIYFYPASFAEHLSNVIAVTTVDPKSTRVSGTQNFSRKVVNIGVPADRADFRFRNPRIQNDFISGSSYATPIVTGLIAGNCFRYVNPGDNTKIINDKTEIIKKLLDANKLAVKDDLKPEIKEGIALIR